MVKRALQKWCIGSKFKVNLAGTSIRTPRRSVVQTHSFSLDAVPYVIANFVGSNMLPALRVLACLTAVLAQRQAESARRRLVQGGKQSEREDYGLYRCEGKALGVGNT